MQLARTLMLPLLTVSLVLIVGCQTQEEAQPIDAEEMAEEMSPQVATANLQPLSDSGVSGTASFTTQDGGILVEATVEGLAPNTSHGFHIHENGDCGDAGQAAGGHFAPQGSPHGGPDSPDSLRHVGDLGNLTANADGMATYNRVDSLVAFDGEANIVGKAVIVHAGQDDLESQPTGEAGGRIACGIIEMAGADTMNGEMSDDGTGE